MAGETLISKEALIQAMVAALNARSSSSREGVTESEVREYVRIIYSRSLDEDTSDMKKEIEKFLEKVSGGA